MLAVNFGMLLALYWYNAHTTQQTFVMPSLETLDIPHATALFTQPHTLNFYGLNFALLLNINFIKLFLEFALIYHVIQKMRGLPNSLIRSIAYTLQRLGTVLYATVLYCLGELLITFITTADTEIMASLESDTKLAFLGIGALVFGFIGLIWYLATFFTIPLLVASSISVPRTFIQSLIITWRELFVLAGGEAIILLTGLIIIPITLVGPIILISISPTFYQALLLLLVMPFSAFFHAATIVLSVYLYEEFTKKPATAIK